MCKVSVILPSYNVGKYIRECLNSVVNQSLQEIEIICIDAGSTDGTRDIILEFADRDERIRLIDSEKKSFGYQENLGIALAKGEYIGFVETDDYVRTDMCEVLYNAAKQHNLDYVKANHIQFVNVDETYRLMIKIRTMAARSDLYHVVFKPMTHPAVMWYDSCMWNGMYRADFLRKKKILLNETPGAAYQDMGFGMQVVSQAERIMYLDEELYYYRRDNANSSMHNPNGFINVFGEFQYVKKYMENSPDTIAPQWWAYFYKLLAGNIRNWIYRLLMQYGKLPEDADNILEKIRQECIWGLEKGYILPVGMGYAKMAEIRQLVDDKETYLKNILSETQVKVEAQQHIVEAAQRSNQVIIFGAGMCGKKLYTLLVRNEVKSVVAFCDNNEKKCRQKLFGKDVLPLNNCKALYPEAIYIIATSRYVMDMTRQLKIEAGVESDRIFYYQVTDMEIG